MEDLFRFLLVRPAEEVDAEKAAITLERSSDFQTSLGEALSSDSPQMAARDAVNSFTHSDRYVDSMEKLNLGFKMCDLRKRIEDGEIENLEELRETIQTIFLSPVGALVKSPEFKEDDLNLSNSILAIKLTPAEHNKPIFKLVKVFQTMDLIKRAAANDESLNRAGSMIRVFKTVLIFPEKYSLPSFMSLESSESISHPEKEKKFFILREAQKKAKAINEAMTELMCLRTSDLEVRSTGIDDIGDTVTTSPSPPISGRESRIGRGGFVGRISNIFRRTRGVDVPSEIVNSLPKNIEYKMVISSQAITRLSDSTKAVLEDEEIDISELPYSEAIARLKGPLAVANRIINEHKPDSESRIMGYIGNLPLYMAFEGILPEKDIPGEATGSGIPLSFGNLQPAGIGELMIVKQQLIRYQGGDVAHIENVLKSESKSREHRRTRKTEEFYLMEKETTTEEERDLETTERFELQREAEETIKQQSNLETGLNISASYGSVLQVEASLDYAMEKIQERSKRAASEFSKEVINKSVSKMSEKIREKKTMRLIEEVEEKNVHGFKNEEGDDHVIGVYQWVNKVYEAQVFNYGLRTIYEITLPEPGAFLWKALKRNVEEEVGVRMPPEFNLQPDQLDEMNYHRYVKIYQVTGVEPPPEEFKTFTKTFSGGPKTGEEGGGSAETAGLFSEVADIEIDDDYEAIEGRAVVSYNTLLSPGLVIEVAIGAYPHNWSDTGTRKNPVKFLAWDSIHGYDTPNCSMTPLDHQTNKVPVLVGVTNALTYSVIIEVKCKVTSHAKEKWQQTTHTAIMQAYLKLKADYEERLAARSIQDGLVISGRNPEANRKLEKEELKKTFISMITQQHYDDFNAIENDTVTGLPRTNLPEAEAEGKYIRFFEQAFEWENMTYILYPYFWGRKEKWKDRVRYEDPDPKFVEFISAGAARVVVPARPDFDAAIRHFMTTGEIWLGGELPDIDSPLYVPIVEEMKEQLGAPGNEAPVGEPWHVTLPTNLVRLRPDGSLPRWIKDEHGAWQPEDTTDDNG